MSNWITARQAATYTATSLPTIYRAARHGRLRGVKVNHGRVWRFREEWLDDWMGLNQLRTRQLRMASMTTPDRSVAARSNHGVIANLLGLGFGVVLGPSNITLSLAREGVLALRCTTPEAAAWFRAYHIPSPMVVDMTIPVMFYRCDSDLVATYGQGWVNRVRRLGFEISSGVRLSHYLWKPWNA